MSLNNIDDTLVAYFKQMLDEEAFEAEQDLAKIPAEEVPSHSSEAELASAPEEVANGDLSLNSETDSSSLASEEDIDYASDDYVPVSESSSEIKIENASSEIALEPLADEDTSSQIPQMQLQSQEESAVASALPYAEHKSIESLLENVETKVEVVNLAQTETETETEVALETDSVQTEQTDTEVSQEEDTKNDNPYQWENIDMPDEFQVLFFLVKGIRFAVPLVNLGGIFQSAKVTPLFGKPKWFMGLADIRGKKMNVVDTLKWVKSDAPQSDNYEYMIALDKTLWSIGCDKLEGNRILSKDNITWRQQAGNRPWLAGIVKKEMCALLHVEALIKMFENGVNLKDLDTQMSA